MKQMRIEFEIRDFYGFVKSFEIESSVIPRIGERV